MGFDPFPQITIPGKAFFVLSSTHELRMQVRKIRLGFTHVWVHSSIECTSSYELYEFVMRAQFALVRSFVLYYV